MSGDGKVGRPSKFNSEIAEKIIQLFRDGKTEQQVADIVGVHVRTIENWRRLNVQFLWETNEAKQFADEMVEAALFSRAVGYSHPETKMFCHEGCVVTEETTKHYPPDTHAIKFWLANRRPKRWSERQSLELSGKDGGPIEQINRIEIADRVKQLKGEE